MANRNVAHAVRVALVSAGAVGAGLYGATSSAQDQLGEIIVTGSRIVRTDDFANSPVKTIDAAELTQNANVTVDTFLNTLPGVNPAGTTTSNNPGNNGQANVNLRGMGSNRNLVLVDGRRMMPSASTLVVDLNTIPQAMIESIDVVTGGAAAVYGTDAVAGAVNLKLRRNFEGLDISYSHSNSTEHWDAQELVASVVLGGNFAEGRGNAVMGIDYADRELMVKGQRTFAAQATSSTTFLPEGYFVSSSSNPIPQTAINALFATAAYGSHPAGSTNQSLLAFNLDGTLFSTGVFNSPLNVLNFRYPIDLSVNTNTGFYPSFYSYNFDSVNILTLPMERYSFLTKFNYEFEAGVEVFGQLGWTEYSSATALAPTPFPTVTTTAVGQNTAIEVGHPSVMPGQTVPNALIVPVTNPFIPADFRALLAQRTGDDARLVGSGATEPFTMRQRSLDVGRRQSNYENTVVQFLVGAKGPLPADWRWEAYVSEGRTEIDQQQAGNLDTNRLYELIWAADGGASRCAGGLNIFGRQPISPECQRYLAVSGNLSTEFKMNVVQGFVAGDVFDMPAGPMSAVIGVEGRYFEYTFDPGTSSGPISGFNAQSPVSGKNEFEDIFVEALFPLVRDAAYVEALDLNVGFRNSSFKFEDLINDVSSPSKTAEAYFANFSWQMNDMFRFRGGYQRAVRAPNFNELFSSGGSAPQYYDPCNSNSAKRTGPDAAAMRALCLAQGISSAAIDTFIAPPGGQLTVTIAGNTALSAETADSYNIGVIFNSPWSGALENLRASLDWSLIEITDTIVSPSPNTFIADCYNYYGRNPTYSTTQDSCRTLVRSGGALARVQPLVNNVPTRNYPGINAGEVTAQSLDLTIDWGMDLPKGKLRTQLALAHLLELEVVDLPALPVLDYKGSVAYFGAGLGASFPENRINLTAVYSIGDFSFDARARWIDSMINRALVQFPGESASLTGVPSVTYLDLGATWRPEFMGGDWTVRLGVNNVSDKQPPGYAPNVQSGTESSLYDVIGRRIFGQFNVKF